MPNIPAITNVPFDPIMFAEPDTSFPVPELFNENNGPVLASKGSAYFCKSPKRFIVDIKMATYSNTDPVQSGPEKGVPTNPTGAMTVWAGPWDVPGSWFAQQPSPHWNFALEDDIDRYEFDFKVYLKPHGGVMQKKKDLHLTKGQWLPNSQPPFGFPNTEGAYYSVQVSQAGWDIYRFAVACVMRGAPQQVAVGFKQEPVP